MKKNLPHKLGIREQQDPLRVPLIENQMGKIPFLLVEINSFEPFRHSRFQILYGGNARSLRQEIHIRPGFREEENGVIEITPLPHEKLHLTHMTFYPQHVSFFHMHKYFFLQHIAVKTALPRDHLREETADVFKIDHNPYTFSSICILLFNALLAKPAR